MRPDEVLRAKARRIRNDVAYDTKWGTNFPHVQESRLREAKELDEAADRLARRDEGSK